MTEGKKKQVRHIIIYQCHFEIKLFISQMSQKKTSLDDADNDDWEQILMGLINELIFSFSFLKS